MTGKHTPGPWSLRAVKRAEAGHATQTNVNAQNWEGLAVVYGTSDGTPEQLEEATANARLVAAAPDLLEACRHALRGWVGKSECDFDVRPIIAAVDKATFGTSKQDAEDFADRIKALADVRCTFLSDIDG